MYCLSLCFWLFCHVVHWAAPIGFSGSKNRNLVSDSISTTELPGHQCVPTKSCPGNKMFWLKLTLSLNFLCQSRCIPFRRLEPVPEASSYLLPFPGHMNGTSSIYPRSAKVHVWVELFYFFTQTNTSAGKMNKETGSSLKSPPVPQGTDETR